jgi:hypothetical protein
MSTVDRSIVASRRATIALSGGLPSLRVEALGSRGFRGTGGAARAVDVQPLGQTRSQPLERELTVPGLRPSVGGRRAHDRPESLEEPGALPGPERRGLGHGERHLHAGVRGVGVLATGSAGPTRAPLELVEGDRTARRDAETSVHTPTIRALIVPTG